MNNFPIPSYVEAINMEPRKDCSLSNVSFVFPKKTPSISYKILQMRLLCTNPCRDAIVPSYVDAH